MQNKRKLGNTYHFKCFDTTRILLIHIDLISPYILDLVDEYQQYQEATVDDDDEDYELEADEDD